MRDRFREFRQERRLERLRRSIPKDDNLQGVGTVNGRLTAFVLEIGPAVQAYGASGIDYVRVGPFKAIPPEEIPAPYDNLYRFRPVVGGVSVGHILGTAGTASLKVRDKTDNRSGLLSNYHVLAMDPEHGTPMTEGLHILQPGPYDLGVPADKIGNLRRFKKVEMGGTDVNLVDCALASLDSEAIMTEEILNVGYVPGTATAYVGQQVRKCGRTTGWDRRGHVTSTDLTVQVSYPPERSPRVGLFKDCILVEDNDGNRNFSRPGDSGSAIVDFSNNQLIGLLFAGTAAYTIICKIQNVFQALNIDLPPAPDITRTLWLDISHWQGDIPMAAGLPGSDVEAYQQPAMEAAYQAGVYKINAPNLKAYSFTGMKAKGVQGVMMKACQGATLIDNKFAEYYERAKAAGLLVIPYIFVDPQYSAQQHYDNFLRAVGSRTFDGPPMLDCEIYSGKDNATVTAVIQSLAAKVAAWAGQNPLIYTSLGFWNAHVNRWSGWKNYPLHVAYWSQIATIPGLPQDWTDYAIWQHEVSRAVDWFGVQSAGIDMNTTKYKNFVKLLGEGEPPPPPPEQYTLSVAVSGSGRVEVQPAQAAYDPGTSVQLTAVPGEGWKFSGWAGALTGAGNPASLVMDGNKSVTAAFEALPAGEKTEYITYRAKVVNPRGVYCRKGSGTSFGYWFLMPVGEVVDVLEEINRGPEDKWARIGKQQYCALRYLGVTYLEYL